MATDPHHSPITAEGSPAMDFGSDRRSELSDGVIQMMTGGSATHPRVAGNIDFALRTKLRGLHCEAFNSDMGVRVDATTVRYPDVTVYRAGTRALERDGALASDDPRAIFEVLSPTTTTFGQGTKLQDYKRVASVDTIVFADAVDRLTRCIKAATITSGSTRRSPNRTTSTCHRRRSS